MHNHNISSPIYAQLVVTIAFALSPICLAQAASPSDSQAVPIKIFDWQSQQIMWESRIEKWRFELERIRWSATLDYWEQSRSRDRGLKILSLLAQRYQNPTEDAINDFIAGQAYESWADATEFALALKPTAQRNLQLDRRIASSINMFDRITDTFGLSMEAADIALEITSSVGTAMMASNPPIYLTEITPLGAMGYGSLHFRGGTYLEWGEALSTSANRWWNRGNIHRVHWDRWETYSNSLTRDYRRTMISNTPATHFVERFMMHHFPLENYFDSRRTQYKQVTTLRETYRIVTKGGMKSYFDSSYSDKEDSQEYQLRSRTLVLIPQRFIVKRNWCEELPCYDDSDPPLFLPPGRTFPPSLTIHPTTPPPSIRDEEVGGILMAVEIVTDEPPDMSTLLGIAEESDNESPSQPPD